MLQTIQAGRGIAALLVAAFHLSIAMGDARYGGSAVFREITWRGNFGVDFFFVLSGFIMMFVHEKDLGRPNRWPAYACARFFRLFPAYWLFTIIFCYLVFMGWGEVTSLPTSFTDLLSAF